MQRKQEYINWLWIS